MWNDMSETLAWIKPEVVEGNPDMLQLSTELLY